MSMLAAFPSLALSLVPLSATQGAGDGPSTVGSVGQLGLGTSGAGGTVRLTMGGAPLDTHPFELRVRGGAPGAVGSIIASLSQVPVYSPRFGTTLFFGPKVASEGFVVGPDGSSPPLFDVAALTSAACGISFVAQAAVLDATAQGGAAITQALDVTIGRKVHGPYFPASFKLAGTGSIEQVLLLDANEDTLVDIVALQRSTGDVAVFPGFGTGAFGDPIISATGTSPWSLAPGDFNQDGHLDLVVARLNDDMISVMPGAGDGTFGPAVDLDVVSQPIAVAVEELNGTPSPEVIAVSRPQGEIVVLRGESDPPLYYTVGTMPTALDVGDLNGDGNPDVVVANSGSDDVSVLLGNGDATFQPAQNHLVGDHPDHVTVADVDDDGDLDVIVSNTTSQNVHLLRGNGDGTLDPKVRLVRNFTPFETTVLDLNRDGISDIAIAAAWEGEVVQLHGNGSGQFTIGPPIAASTPMDVLSSDLDGDGLDDLLTQSPSTVGIFPALASGGFVEATELPVPSNVNQILAADFDGDQIQDVAMRIYIPGYVEIRLGDGNGGFRPTTQTINLPGNVVWIAVADLDANGTADLVIAEDTGPIQRRLGVGDGTFSAPLTIATAGAAISIQPGDLDGDEVLDLALFAELGEIGILFGVGDGSFEPLVKFPSVTFPNDLELGDIDDDGDLDIAVSDGNNKVVTYRGFGDGTFDQGTTLNVGSANATITEIAIEDRDGDGFTDLFVMLDGSGALGGELSFCPGLPNGTLGPEQLRPTGSSGESLVLGDVNGDLLQDVIVGGSGVHVFTGQPDGSLATTADTYGSTVRDHLLMDMNGDELPDILIVRQSSFLILENRLMR